MLLLDILSIMAALIAAFLWYKSAKIKTPDSFSIHVVKPDMPPMGQPMGGTYQGHAYSNDLISLAEALKTQSKNSGNAALFTAISVLLQAISIMIKHVSC